jgi:glutaredoxin
MPGKVTVYTKPDCPLCAGLVSKLTEIQTVLNCQLELRDITTQAEWWERYQFTVPVLLINGRTFPRPSPRLSPERLVSLLLPALGHENPHEC